MMTPDLPPHVREAMGRLEDFRQREAIDDYVPELTKADDCETVAYWLCDAMANAPSEEAQDGK